MQPRECFRPQAQLQVHPNKPEMKRQSGQSGYAGELQVEKGLGQGPEGRTIIKETQHRCGQVVRGDQSCGPVALVLGLVRQNLVK
jgi:hypothetical protein